MTKMRIVLSRKGFDSVSGGGPSPVLEDGTMLSLPIPELPGQGYAPGNLEEVNWRKYDDLALDDGKHIHPAVLRMLIKLMGKERVILISDSMRATGMPDGEYDLGGQTMTVKDGTALTADGHLAGSTSTLFECVKFLINSGVDEADAVMMASETPSRLMGLNKGRIEVGYDADFIFVNERFDLKNTMISGRFCKQFFSKEV